jgi:hypothetical protein
VGLTRRSLLFEHCLTEPDHCLLASDTSAAAANNGFLAEVLQCNDGIRQQVSALASQDWQQDLEFVEITATAPASGGDIDRLPNTQMFKEALRDVAIDFSGAKGKEQVIFVKWRSEGIAANGVSRTTIYNVGFNPASLQVEFLRRVSLADEQVIGGFRIHQSAITVFKSPSTRGFRFYVPIPTGWTDEMLLNAMIHQGGLDPDHLLDFGVDSARNKKVSVPSGDMYFNYAPAGCINHGSDILIPITQPPGRMFVEHPVSGAENHLKIKKAGACSDCWAVPGRHPTKCDYKDICRMCLVPYSDMPLEGRRHACGQGHLSKPREKREVDPGVIPISAPAPSTMAAKIKAKQLANINAAQAKRKRVEEVPAAAEVDPTPAEAAVNKSPKTDGPGGSSPGGSANTDPTVVTEQAPAPAPATTTAKPKKKK